jgi:ABC-type nitrate/sulfonate/bicarbonate transport system permease component
MASSQAIVAVSGAAPGAVRHRVAGLVVPLLLLALWQVGAMEGALPRYLVAPSVILRTIAEMAWDGELWRHVGASLFRAGMGFAIGMTSGVALGLAAGMWARLERFYDPIISLTYPVPKVALLPVIFAWFGLGDASKIVVIVASVFYPAYISAFYGAKSVEKLHVWAARNMGAGSWTLFWRVILPSALPQIFSGLRIGLGMSFVTVFTAELIASQSGLGYLVGVAQDSARFDLMYVAIVSVGIIGFAADRALLALRDRLLVGQLAGKERGDG